MLRTGAQVIFRADQERPRLRRQPFHTGQRRRQRRLVHRQIDSFLQTLSGGEGFLPQRGKTRLVVRQILVDEHLLLGVRQRLLVLRALDDLDLGVGQPVELIDDLVDQRVGGGKLRLDGQQHRQRTRKLPLDLPLHLLQRDAEAAAILV